MKSAVKCEKLQELNSRLQPVTVALGTTAGAADLLRLDLEYGGWTQNGTIDPSANSGNISRQTVTVPWETRGGQTYAAFTAVQSYNHDGDARQKKKVCPRRVPAVEFSRGCSPRIEA